MVWTLQGHLSHSPKVRYTHSLLSIFLVDFPPFRTCQLDVMQLTFAL